MRPRFSSLLWLLFSHGHLSYMAFPGFFVLCHKQQFLPPQRNPQQGSEGHRTTFWRIIHGMGTALSQSKAKPNQNWLVKSSNYSHSKSNKGVTRTSDFSHRIFKGGIKFLQSYLQHPLPLCPKRRHAFIYANVRQTPSIWFYLLHYLIAESCLLAPLCTYNKGRQYLSKNSLLCETKS